MPPRIFTGSPIEAHIVAVFMKAQVAMASFFHENPVFRSLLFAALLWAVLQQFLRIATTRAQAGQAVVTIVYRVGMVFLAIALLSREETGVQFSSPDELWASYSSVQRDDRYRATLRTPTTSLWAYSLVYQAIDGVAQSSASAAAEAFDDRALTRDPTFFAQQMARMASFTLSPTAESKFLELVRDCGRTDVGRVVRDPYTSIEELLDLETIPGAPALDESCATKWRSFQDLTVTEGANLIEQYPPFVRTRLNEYAQQRFGVAPEQLQRVAVSFAIHRSVMDQVSVATDEARRKGAAAPPGEATGADAAPQADTAEDFMRRFAAMNGLSGLDPSDPASRGWLALTAQFNALAPYIPAARGFMQGILAILFVVAVYSLGFGTWRFMQMWFLAEASLCLYKPVALLGYKVSEYFLLEDRLATAIMETGTDGMVIGGARILHDQMSRIQTVYVAFEIGAFMIFALGALACFRPLAAVSGHLGSLMAGHAGSAFQGAGRAFGLGAGGGAPASSVPVPAGVPAVLSVGAAAGSTAGSASGPGAQPLATGGLGIQPPAPQQTSNWDHAA